MIIPRQGLNECKECIKRKGVDSVSVFLSNRPSLAVTRSYQSIVLSLGFDWLVFLGGLARVVALLQLSELYLQDLKSDY